MFELELDDELKMSQGSFRSVSICGYNDVGVGESSGMAGSSVGGGVHSSGELSMPEGSADTNSIS